MVAYCSFLRPVTVMDTLDHKIVQHNGYRRDSTKREVYRRRGGVFLLGFIVVPMFCFVEMRSSHQSHDSGPKRTPPLCRTVEACTVLSRSLPHYREAATPSWRHLHYYCTTRTEALAAKPASQKACPTLFFCVWLLLDTWKTAWWQKIPTCIIAHLERITIDCHLMIYKLSTFQGRSILGLV